MHLNSSPSQSTCIFSSVLLSEYSLLAVAPMLSTCSSLSMMPMLIMADTENASLPPCGLPSTLKMPSQCRGSSAGLATSCSSGRYCLKASISSRSRITTWSSRRCLSILYAPVPASSTAVFTSSSCKLCTAPDIHSLVEVSNSCKALQVSFFVANSFMPVARLLKSSTGILNSAWYLRNRSPFSWWLVMRRCTLSSSMSTAAGSAARSTKESLFSSAIMASSASSNSVMPFFMELIISALRLSM
mmetsp:Transcript_4869/g.12363  ORF Transcript_4869/g.12363 Transcript_4869/m.12363 type:complete len:244 (-) Transcript_4869:1808-2539(-)